MSRAGRTALALGLIASLATGAALAAGDAPQPDIRAQLSPVRSTVLSTEIPGRVADLTVREGDRFTEGQRLVQFDCTVHKARLDKALAQQQQARKSHQVHARLDKLGSNSALEYETSAAQLAGAEAEVAMMRAMVERCSVNAPFAGRVVELKVKRHQYLAEGHELLEILDDREMEVEMVVPSRWLPWLTPGYPFALRLDETRKEYPAKVVRTGARIDPVSQSVKVFGTVDGRFPELVAGMSGSAVMQPPQ